MGSHNPFDYIGGTSPPDGWGQRQLDNVLGANPWGVSLVRPEQLRRHGPAG